MCVCVCVAVYEASQRFYSSQTVVSVVCELGIEDKITAPLHSTTSPEEKRVIIGNTFMKVRYHFVWAASKCVCVCVCVCVCMCRLRMKLSVIFS